jgi:rhodanese-related sulfurtransferase
MLPILIAVGAVALLVLIVFLVRRARVQREMEMERHSITAEALHGSLASEEKVLVFDVRQPLDLLAHSELIPGARRVAPAEVLENPALIPKEKDSVVYCTCPSDKTSREILRRAMGLGFYRIKFLKGGLEAWKAMGYPVEPYVETFHLYMPSLAAGSGRPR